MVTGDTRDVLCVIFAPASLDQALLSRALDLTTARFVEFGGAVATGRDVI
jgi:DNA/RNA-binding domain of Phe-tRNA-synthetase-like protein